MGTLQMSWLPATLGDVAGTSDALAESHLISWRQPSMIIFPLWSFQGSGVRDS